jgi:hypothetical protein
MKPMRALIGLSIIALSLFLMPGCQKDDNLPVIPEISFKSLLKYSSQNAGIDSLVLTFAFEDGDGDIGSPDSDTISRDIFVTLFEKQNGTFVPIVFSDTLLLTYRMPYLEPSGNNSSLVGDVVISYLGYLIGVPNDTVRYEIYIRDRAGHRSNTITTSEIVTTVQ